MNVFSIDSLTGQPKSEYDNRVITYECFVRAKVECMCEDHHNIFSTITLQAEGKNPHSNEALRKAVENLLNHHCIPNIDIHMPRCECMPNPRGKVQFDFSSLQEPYKTLFQDLFKDSNWSMPDYHLPSSQPALQYP
jgi:hypothetical protein